MKTYRVHSRTFGHLYNVTATDIETARNNLVERYEKEGHDIYNYAVSEIDEEPVFKTRPTKKGESLNIEEMIRELHKEVKGKTSMGESEKWLNYLLDAANKIYGTDIEVVHNDKIQPCMGHNGFIIKDPNG